MVRHTDGGIIYAPHYVHSFPLVQPHFLANAEKFNLAYSDLSEIESTADKLRFCRYRKGLLQRDVADYAGIDRSTYVHYEEVGRDYYPVDKLEKIAELFGVSVTRLMDGYNRFLYEGQGVQLTEIRECLRLPQKELASRMGVLQSTVSGWEVEKARMSKSVWERLMRLTG